MVKKKSARQKHQKEVIVGDTSEEELKESNFKGKVCPHIARGLNFARVKKTLKTVVADTCGACAENAEAVNDDLPEVWLCLQCGNRGCGRMSPHQHAIQHFKTIHSDCHSIVLSCLSGIVWCYDCDDEINLQQSRNLRQCVEFLKKSKGIKNTTSDVHKSLAVDHPSSVKSLTNDDSTAVSKVVDRKTANKNKKEILPSKSYVKGLRNLGNTCFFNAVMQNLNQTYVLSRVLERACAPDYIWEVPNLTLNDDGLIEEANNEFLKIAVPKQFPLANSLLQVYKSLNAPSSNKNEIVNPSPLFTEISKKCPQFKHFQEQDSHELLRQLLDGLRQDEVRRQKRALVRHFDVGTIPIEEVDEETKKLIKAYGHYASHTLVEKIFGGLFLSTVLCEECKTSSQVFEPFMDMSLPLFEEKHQDNCNQPHLGGGQQKDFEPFRNRKTATEQEDTNEYVLNKPNKEIGKPSKHQLRKLKELAKKEKKKKNRTRKISETNEDVPDGEEVGENISDFDQGHNVAAEVQEADTNHREIKEGNEEIEDNENIASCNEDNDAESPSNDSKATHVQNGIDVSIEPTNQDNGTLETSENISLIDSGGKTMINIGENDNLPNGIEKSIEQDCGIVPDDFIFEKCGVYEKFESDALSAANSSCDNGAFNSIFEDLLIDELPSQEIPSDLKRAMLGESMSLALQTENISSETTQIDLVENHIDNNSTTKSARALESSCVEVLTENFEALNMSDSIEPDERMQTLGLQVREVRIRRDSDRQGSLLNSSLSPDEDTNLASCESQEDTCDDENDEKWSCNFSQCQIKEWILKSLLTLKPRKKCDPNECSIDSSLNYFTKPELLTGSNKFRCEKCTEIKISRTGNKKDVAYSNASKQFLIFSPPAILTLHLKRFQQVGMSLRKVNRFVEFPSILDLAPYCSSACLVLPHMSSVRDEVLYSLYGVVEHSGRMSSGHYTAYVKTTKRTLNENFMCHLPVNSSSNLEQLLQKFSKISSEKTISSNEPSNDHHWFYISDAHVREVNEAQVMKCQAYLLFYERIK